MSDIHSTLALRSGIQVPRMVFGTGAIFEPGPIHHALDVGYIAFDTAQRYKNERQVGEAIRSYPGTVDRSDLFIITKVNVAGATVEETLDGIRESVDKIGLGGYVDLFLIHDPLPGPAGRKIQWTALEQAKKLGLTRAIGVSNFTVRHLEELRSYASEMPEVNQIELSPFNQEKEITAYCQKEGIQLQAFAPVARGQKADDAALLEISKQVGKNWNKVLLRWSLQRGLMVTCKSATPSRISDNAEIFDFSLDDEQMQQLNALDCGFRVTPSTLATVEERQKWMSSVP